MRIKFLWKCLGAVLLSTLLTAECLFAAPALVDRQALVRATYENFLPILYFLSGSNRFREKLSPDEFRQFELLGQLMIQQTIRLGSALPTPGQDQTSRHVSFQLRFSDHHEDFVLNPGEPERTAKFDGQMWFNLNMLNDPKLAFGPLDTMQILFHEFGHLLKEKKDQGALDRVAAKIREYLAPFAREEQIRPGLKVSTLILPYITAAGSPVDFQPEPIVVFDAEGQTFEANVDMLGLKPPEQGYQSANSSVQAFARIQATPRFQVYGDGILIEWAHEIKHFFVNAFRFNYLDLFTNVALVSPLEALEPITENSRVYQRLSNAEIEGARSTRDSRRLRLQTFAQSPEPFTRAENQKWIEKLRINGTTSGAVELEGVIESAKPLTEVQLLGQHRNQVLRFSGVAQFLGANQYRLRFSVPQLSALSNPVHLQGIALNGEDRWDLDQRIDIPIQALPVPTDIKIKDVSVWSEHGWVPVETLRTVDVQTDAVKFRFELFGAVAPVEHFEGSWMVHESIWTNNRIVGTRMRTVVETIPASRLQQSYANGVRTVEFTSDKATLRGQETVGKSGFVARDNHFRAFLGGQFVDQTLNTIGLGTRLTNQGWKSIFKLGPAGSARLRCAAVFNP